MPEVEAALDNTEDGFITSCEKAARFLSGDFEDWDHDVTSIRERQEREGISVITHTAILRMNNSKIAIPGHHILRKNFLLNGFFAGLFPCYSS